MTCIVGVRQNGRVWLGGDSAGTMDDWSLYIRTDPKVFQVGEFLIGFTWSFRMGQLLRYAFAPPLITGDLYAYLVTTWVDAMRECFKAGGFARKDMEAEQGGQFLVGVRGRLFNVQSDYSIGEVLMPYDAVGCGAPVALGALAVLHDLPPAARCRKALRAAELHNAGVRGPFIVRSCRNGHGAAVGG